MINRYTFAGLAAVLAVCLVGVVIFLLANRAGLDARGDDAAGHAERRGGRRRPRAPRRGHGHRRRRPAARSRRPSQQAAQAAGCVLKNPPDEGAEHVPRDPSRRPTTAPTRRPRASTRPSGRSDGIYRPHDTPTLGNARAHARARPDRRAVQAGHAGRRRSTRSPSWVKSADGGYHMLLFQNTTQMPYAVAATAWDHLIGCPQYNAKVITALKFFREAVHRSGPGSRPLVRDADHVACIALQWHEKIARHGGRVGLLGDPPAGGRGVLCRARGGDRPRDRRRRPRPSWRWPRARRGRVYLDLRGGELHRLRRRAPGRRVRARHGELVVVRGPAAVRASSTSSASTGRVRMVDAPPGE